MGLTFFLASRHLSTGASPSSNVTTNRKVKHLSMHPTPKTATGLSIPKGILRMLHAPAPPPAQNIERVTESKNNSPDTPRASAATAQNSEKVVDCEQNSQEASRASAATAQNSEKVIDTEQSSQDAPEAGAATRGKEREGRRFKAEFAGRSARQRAHPPKTARRFAMHVETSHGARARALRQNSHGATATAF